MASSHLNVFDKAFLPSKTLGLVPFSIKDGKLILSRVTIYSLCAGTGLVVFTVCHLGPSETIDPVAAPVPDFIFHLRLPLFLLGTLAAYCCHREKLVSCISAMESVHYELAVLGSTPTYYTPKVGIVLNFVILATGFAACCQMHTISTLNRPLKFLLLDIVLTTASHCIVSFLTLIECQFRCLRRKLLKDAAACPMPLRTKRFQLLSSLHNVLVNCCNDINTVFNFQILFIVTNHFLIICFLMAISTVNLSFISSDLVTILSYCQLMALVINFIISILMLANRCTKVSEEAKEFNILLYHLMIDDKTNEILNNRKLRLHIAMKRETAITVCGLFNLDFNLVFSMIAAATTYLVILVQFGRSRARHLVPATSLDFGNTTTTAFPSTFTAF